MHSLRDHADAVWSSATGLRTGAKHRTQILVIDNDERMLGLLRELLVDEGYGVTEAATGAGVLEAMPARVELLVMDLDMVGLDGLETLRRLRARGCEIPTILIARFPDEAARHCANHLGAPLLGKTFLAEDLGLAVENLLLMNALEMSRRSGASRARW